MRNQSVTGIIIKKNKYSDFHEFVTIFSPETGKIDAIARSSRKINSPFTGHLEILNICRFQLYKNNERYSITQCQTISPFKFIRSNLRLTLLSLSILEIFNQLAGGETSKEELFNLLQTTLDKINTPHPSGIRETITKAVLQSEIFKIKALQIAGSLPLISECAHCHQKWQPQSNIFIDADNHFCCEICNLGSSASKSSMQINFDIMKLLNFIAKTDNQTNLDKIRPTNAHLESLKIITDRYLHEYTQKEVVSEKIAATMQFQYE